MRIRGADPKAAGGLEGPHQRSPCGAAQFYSLGEIGVGRAASIAGLERRDFEKWLGDHGVGIPWNDADVETEVAGARRLSGR